MLTNDVPINERGIRQILISATTLLARSNILAASTNAFIGDKELRADQPYFWLLHNTSSNQSGGLFPDGHAFAFELQTINGVVIPKTELGEKMSETPKSLNDWRNGRTKSLSTGEFKIGDFPVLTSLFNFPSNGVYIFELRCWAWQNSKKQFALSDPIRVRVIKEDTNRPPPVMEPIKP
jgi:hypothetical protein